MITPSAAFYARVSTDRQDNSLRAQETKAREYATLKRLELPPELVFPDEDASGKVSMHLRPGGALMLNTLRMRPDVKDIIITKVDRLGRNFLDLETTIQRFKGQGITLHIIDFGGDSLTTRGFFGDLVLRILSAFAHFERELIKERTTTTFTQLRKEGRVVGTVPFGWDAVPTGQFKKDRDGKQIEIRKLEPNFVEQKALRDMWRWRNELHLSYQKIANQLNRDGVPTKNGAPGRTGWQCGNVAGVLDSRYAKEFLAKLEKQPAA